nr:TetR/AcrR family transcriptional regulator [Kofleriaceae bacterium]
MSGRSSSRTTKPPPLKARLREAASGAILDAVEDVALERGIDNASIAAIADRAGVAVGTLYNYFPDREAMIAALFRARRGELAPRVSEAARLAEPLPFEDRLRAYTRGVLAAFDARRPFVRLAIAMDQQGRRVPDDRPNLIGVFLIHVEAIFRDAAGKHQLPDDRVAELARFYIGAMKAYNAYRLELDEVADADFLVDTFLHGAGHGPAHPESIP